MRDEVKEVTQFGRLSTDTSKSSWSSSSVQTHGGPLRRREKRQRGHHACYIYEGLLLPSAPPSQSLARQRLGGVGHRVRARMSSPSRLVRAWALSSWGLRWRRTLQADEPTDVAHPGRNWRRQQLKCFEPWAGDGIYELAQKRGEGRGAEGLRCLLRVDASEAHDLSRPRRSRGPTGRGGQSSSKFGGRRVCLG